MSKLYTDFVLQTFVDNFKYDALVKDINLLRTDTTLDLSQKAEKSWLFVWEILIWDNNLILFFHRTLQYNPSLQYNPVRLHVSACNFTHHWLVNQSVHSHVALNRCLNALACKFTHHWLVNPPVHPHMALNRCLHPLACKFTHRWLLSQYFTHMCLWTNAYIPWLVRLLTTDL